MPGNIGLPEIAIVLVIVLIIFGPKRLPELGQSLGRGIREFKGSIGGDHDGKPLVTELDEGESAKVETTVTATPVDSENPRKTPPAVAARMGKIKPIAHEDELSLVEHLDELRTRLIVTLGVFGVVLAVCFWQNAKVLEFVNKPLPTDIVPATFAVSEAFMSTLTVTGYAALIIISPLIVYQLYAFVVPAFSEDEQRVARPLVLMTPLLFIAGCAFGYYFVLPTAVTFLLNFNDDQFNILLRASDYYSFFGLTVLAMGALFELPLAILIAARMGLVTSAQLRSNRRYAVLIIAVLAMLLPGVDPVSMLIEMVPLLLLFELSIWLTVWFAKPELHEDPVTTPNSHEPDAAMR